MDLSRCSQPFIRSCFVLVLWLAVISSASEPISCEPCRCTSVLGNNNPISMDCSRLNLNTVPEFLKDGNYTNVTRLYLNNNNITELTGSPFSGLLRLESLFLSDNRISYIGDNVFDGRNQLSILELNRNHLTNESFSDLAFNNLNVHTLDLSRNRLSEPPKASIHAKSINSLNLHHNPMFMLRNEAFKGYGRSIASIDVSDCQLEELEAGVFDQEYFGNLENVYMDNNNFTVLRETFFQKARIRQKLTIRYSNIRSIERNAFKNFGAIRYLYLDGNNLGNASKRKAFNHLIVTYLNLKNCGITKLTPGFLQLEIRGTLDLSDNNITVIHPQSFKNLKYVKKIILTNCNIQEIWQQPFEQLTDLGELMINNNQLNDSSENFLGKMSNLYLLDISTNKFQLLPNLTGLPSLYELFATNNRLHTIESNTFNTTEIRTLRLTSNPLEYIADDVLLPMVHLSDLNVGFTSLAKLPLMHNLTELKDLNLFDANVTELPVDFCLHMPQISTIHATSNALTALPDLGGCTMLSLAFFDKNRIKKITENTFRGAARLMGLYLHDNEIDEIHPEAFQGLSELSFLNLGYNRISNLPPGLFDGLTELETLQLQNNVITSLPTDIFKDLVRLNILYLNKNQISSVGPTLFNSNMTWLERLNISDNPHMRNFPIPKDGFPFLKIFAMMNLPLILNAPSLSEIPRIQYIYVTYPYHCCIYREHLPHELLITRKKVKSSLSVSQNEKPTPYDERYHGNGTYADFTNSIDSDETIWTIIRVTAEPLTLPPHIIDGNVFPDRLDPYNPSEHSITDDDIRKLLQKYVTYDHLSIRILPNKKIDLVGIGEQNETVIYSSLSYDSLRELFKIPFFNNISQVYCSPPPNAFMPCENLLDPDPVRVLIWVVWFPIILGNIAVIFVIMASSEKVDVPSFILCNLALADFMLGIYLSFLAVVDVRTFGDGSFYKSALHWQHGPGCKTAGFIGVFACELSAYLMVILTLERLHTIVYSFNRQGSRIKMRQASILVVGGWIFALISASLPLVDVSSYTEVAVCLPFRTTYLRDKIYIGVLLSLSVVASVVILFSYLHILIVCYKSPSSECRERVMTSVKLGILVLSNLACWVPFGVLGLAALAEEYLVNLTVAKYFIVLVLPINACLNPFLYTISKKAFWQRCQTVCKKTDGKFQDGTFSINRYRRNSLVSAASTTSSCPQDIVDMDLVYRRQNRRASSLQVGTVPHAMLSMIQESLSPADPCMGRRNSSPAIFGADCNTNNGRKARRMPSDPTLMEQTDGGGPYSSHVPIRAQTEFNRTNSNCLSIVHEETSLCGSDNEENNHNSSSDIQSPFRFSKELKALHKTNSDTSTLYSRHSASEYVRRSLRSQLPSSSYSNTHEETNGGVMMARAMSDNESDCSDEYDDARSSPLPLSSPFTSPHPMLLQQHRHYPSASLEEDTGYCDSEEMNRFSLLTSDTTSSCFSETITNRLHQQELTKIINPHIKRPSKDAVESTC